MKILMIFLLLGGLALLAHLEGCAPPAGSDNYDYYNYECTIDNVQGSFVTWRGAIRTHKKMIIMYRITDGKRRTFMFPQEKVQCAEKL